MLNAGYAGRSQEDVAAHVAELAELGVPAPPSVTPALYPVSPYLAQQTSRVSVQHGRTSGEAEWALVVDGAGELLLTAACDHTDRELEVHGVAWSKNAGPDVLARTAPGAWRTSPTAWTTLTLRAWVTHDGEETAGPGRHAGRAAAARRTGSRCCASAAIWCPGTVLISGTIPMTEGVDQFADRWRVELADPATGDVIELAYDVVPMPEPIG